MIRCDRISPAVGAITTWRVSQTGQSALRRRRRRPMAWIHRSGVSGRCRSPAPLPHRSPAQLRAVHVVRTRNEWRPSGVRDRQETLNPPGHSVAGEIAARLIRQTRLRMSEHLAHGFGDLRHEVTLVPQAPSTHVVRDVGRHQAEINEPVVGDELILDATLVATAPIDCDARPAEVYPWLAQMGFGKAGWYSYDLLDNLGRKSAAEIVPAWQVVEGESVPVVRSHSPRRSLAPEKRSCWPFNATCSTSRLHSSCEPTAREPASSAGCGHGPLRRPSSSAWLGPGDGIMVRKQLLELQNAPLADSPCRYRDRMAKSQKKRDIPAGATAVATNRGGQDFDILDEIEFGIMLKGSEVKSLRESKVQLRRLCRVLSAGVVDVGLNISAYSHSGTAFAHDNDRRRKLLAHRHQLETGRAESTERVLVIIPLALISRTDEPRSRWASPEARSSTIVARTSPRARLDARKAMSRARRSSRQAAPRWAKRGGSATQRWCRELEGHDQGPVRPPAHSICSPSAARTPGCALQTVLEAAAHREPSHGLRAGASVSRLTRTPRRRSSSPQTQDFRLGRFRHGFTGGVARCHHPQPVSMPAMINRLVMPTTTPA